MVNIFISIVNNIVFLNWDKDKILFSVIFLVIKGIKRFVIKEDIFIKMGISDVVIIDFEIMYMLVMIVILKKIFVKFVNNWEINNLINELDI